MKLRNDITGQKMGRLTVVRVADERMDGGIAWHCLCDCGKEKVIRAHSLLKQHKPTRSCGCIMKEVISRVNKTHGMSYGPTYHIWGGVITRCYNKKDKSYVAYGGRGIITCAAIRASVTGIVDVIGERPSSKTIDRIDNSAGYFCGVCQECMALGRSTNIRWATLLEQGCNQSTNHLVEINGEKRPIAEWARRSGLKAVTILARICRGWQGEEILGPLMQNAHSYRKIL